MPHGLVSLCSRWLQGGATSGIAPRVRWQVRRGNRRLEVSPRWLTGRGPRAQVGAPKMPPVAAIHERGTGGSEQDGRVEVTRFDWPGTPEKGGGQDLHDDAVDLV